MKKSILFCLLIFTIPFSSCTTHKNFLVLVEDAENHYAYINNSGDTIIPFGKYEMCFTDTIENFGIVLDKNIGFIGIDKKENVLFKVFIYDNGPDYISEGLFRIVKEGKIGYANTLGKIVIPPQFDCAFPFENGKAKVSKNCCTINKNEHSQWKSNAWYHIDNRGAVLTN